MVVQHPVAAVRPGHGDLLPLKRRGVKPPLLPLPPSLYWPHMKLGRQFWFGAICVALSVVVALAAIEAISSFYVPSWPGRALRPTDTVNAGENSWGMWDKERT